VTTLDAGLDPLIGYVPPNVRRRLTAGLTELPHEERFNAGVLIADISGFSRMTAKVIGQGPEGAETFSQLLNSYFGQLIDCVDGRGGDVVSFTGDGLIAVWPQRSDETLADVLHCASECALALAETVGDHPAARDVRLSVRLGVSAGSLRALELGGVGRRRFIVLGGEPLEAASRASEQAPAGHVSVDARRWRLIGPRANGEHDAAGGVRLAAIEPAPPRRSRTGQVLPPAALLAPYIPPPVMSREEIGQGSWLAELRRVSVVLVNLPHIDYRSEPELVQRAVVELQREFERYEATINNFVVDAKGTSVLAATGLPPLSHDDDPVRAV
jgi:class 3 adenylate cyclase